MEYLVFLGAIVGLIGTFSYIIEIIKGKVKPNRVSWLMWSIAPLIAAFAAISSGVTLSVIPVFISGFGPFLILIVSLFKKGSYWEIGKLDIICGMISLFALILWYMTKNPVIAITFAIISDFLAAVPTILKSWKYPETESSITFMGGLFSALTSYAAIRTWNFTSVAFATYLVIINIVFILLIEQKRIFKKKG